MSRTDDGPPVIEGAPGDEPGPEPVAASPTTRSRRSPLRTVLEWVAVVVVAVAVALVIRGLVLQPFYIPSGSMIPALEVGDRVLVNKLSYRFGDVDRGDIVVFDRPPDSGPSEIKDLIKRVVGLPGDSLVIADGRVEINGEPLDEGYLPDGSTTGQGPVSCTAEAPCEIPEGHVWVMGDNRGNSQDSRWFGPIPEDTIVGRAFLLMWPLDSFGLL
jgi:signal peptidase I